MPRKYIKIKHLQVRLPFKECVIQFVIRRLEKDPLPSSQIEFYAKSINYALEENIELLYSEKHINSLGIYLMAINPDNRVASIGFVPLKLTENCIDRKQKLRGVNEQTGSIVFSMQDEPFARMSRLANFKIDSSNSAHSSEELSSKGNLREKLELKRSELAQEQDMWEEEQMKESKVEVYQSKEVPERTLQRSKEEDKIVPVRPKQQKPQINQNSSQKNVVQEPKGSVGLLMAKSEVADQMEFCEQQPIQQEVPNQDTNLAHSEREELQSFLIELLKHKLHNREHFQTIKKNQTFLEQQRRLVEQIVEQRIKN